MRLLVPPTDTETIYIFLQLLIKTNMRYGNFACRNSALEQKHNTSSYVRDSSIFELKALWDSDALLTTRLNAAASQRQSFLQYSSQSILLNRQNNITDRNYCHGKRTEDSNLNKCRNVTCIRYSFHHRRRIGDCQK